MIRDLDCRDQNSYKQTVHYLEETFDNHGNKLQKVKEIAQRIKNEIAGISPFIQQTTQIVCPDCKDVCCINKHGYYNYEDLVYLYALGLKPPDYESRRKDTDPCQLLSENGCSLERPFRPSGCNWYFCDSLLESMEKRADYHEFDNSLQDVANLWMEMINEFDKISTLQRS
jgi:hypothetical protein